MPAGREGLRHGLHPAPFDELADPHMLLALASHAEQRGWDGIVPWDRRPPSPLLFRRLDLRTALTTATPPHPEPPEGRDQVSQRTLP